MPRQFTVEIDEDECIGDSLETLNTNFSALDVAVQSLTAVTNNQTITNTNQSTQISNLETKVTNVSAQVFASNSILQMVYKESSIVQVITSPNITQINDLITSITPKKANSKILLQANINSNGRYVASYGFLEIFSAGSVQRIGGVTNTNSNNAIATTFFGVNTTTNMYNTSITYLHTPSYSLGQTLRYAPGACSSWNGVNQSLLINNRESYEDMLSVSTITLTEIA